MCVLCWSLFGSLLYVHSIFCNHLESKERKLVTLFLLSFRCLGTHCLAEVMSSGYPTRTCLNQSAQLHRSARMLKHCLKQAKIMFSISKNNTGTDQIKRLRIQDLIQ